MIRGSVVCRVRFEMINLKAPSWFGIKGSPCPAPNPDFSTKADAKTCPTCDISSKHIFDDGWICLNETCPDFSLRSGTLYNGSRGWNPMFLNERNEWRYHEIPPMRLMPDVPETMLKVEFRETSIAAWKGMVCPRCGRCNSRVQWDEWTCATTGCTFEVPIIYDTISASTLAPDHAFQAEGHSIPFDKYHQPVVLQEAGFKGYWRTMKYELSPGNYVTHYLANQVINRQPGGADEILESLQGAKLGLERLPLLSSPGKSFEMSFIRIVLTREGEGRMHTRHFGINYVSFSNHYP